MREILYFLVRVFRVGDRHYAVATRYTQGQMPRDCYDGIGVTIAGENMDLVLSAQCQEAMVNVRGEEVLEKIGLRPDVVQEVPGNFLAELMLNTGRVVGTTTGLPLTEGL